MKGQKNFFKKKKEKRLRLPGIEPGPPAWGGNHATRQQTPD